MIQENKRNYYSIIPANVRYDNDLNANSKLLYGEITALCNEKGYCWCNNDYFSKLYNVSKTSISKWINLLIKKKYIKSELIYRENTKEIIGRHLYILNTPIEEKLNTPIEEKLNTPIEEKFKYNNTISNKEYIYINKKETIDDLNKEFEEIWKLYPKKKGKSNSLKKYIEARKKGVEKETIKKGIENYKKEIEITNKNYKYIKDGSTWFNKECWNDEYEILENIQNEKEQEEIIEVFEYDWLNDEEENIYESN